MGNAIKIVVALIVAIVIGLTIYAGVRTGLRQIIPNSSGFRILVGAIAGGLGAGIGSLIFTGLKTKLNVQGSGE